MDGTHSHRLTFWIMVAMLSGLLVGLFIRWLPLSIPIKQFFVQSVFHTGGEIFIRLLKMMVVPIVFVSLTLGCASLENARQLGRIGIKTFLLYVLTTAIAVTLALIFAKIIHVGMGLPLVTPANFQAPTPPTVTSVITHIVPTNPVAALANAQMLPIIFFALFFGLVTVTLEKQGKPIKSSLEILNDVFIRMITLIIKLVPLGVFCLLAELFAKIGFQLIVHLAHYFFVVLLVLFIQLIVVYSAILIVVGRLSPAPFYRKMYQTMLFAFSISSSSAAIPVVLRNVRERLGVGNSVASFVIPLGATINMDGTAIMQGVATVFIANAFHIHIGIAGYLTVIAMATLASIGTAGVPSVGLITLAMVLQQVGLPVSGIALIIGVDRLLDMTRTAVNITGDSMIACLVAKTEQSLRLSTYQAKD